MRSASITVSITKPSSATCRRYRKKCKNNSLRRKVRSVCCSSATTTTIEILKLLIRGVALLKKKLHPRTVRLILTCKLNSKDNPGTYHADTAAELVRQLNLGEEVVELGAVPYALLHHLYRACDVYVTPAYAETFAHPLVEAMASGLPVIASDLSPYTARSAANAALYFPRFSARTSGRTVHGSLSVSQNRPRPCMHVRACAVAATSVGIKHVAELLQTGSAPC
jgi:hypothetical protein